MIIQEVVLRQIATVRTDSFVIQIMIACQGKRRDAEQKELAAFIQGHLHCKQYYYGPYSPIMSLRNYCSSPTKYKVK